MRKDAVYSSSRLTYRGISKMDASDIVRWRSDPDNYTNFFSSHALTMEEHVEWFEGYMEDETRYDFIIEDEGNKSIGTVSLSNIGQDSCEVSYMIGEKDARGLGYASEAARAMARIAVEELGVDEVIARIMPHNEASASAARRAGFVESARIFSFQPPDVSS